MSTVLAAEAAKMAPIPDAAQRQRTLEVVDQALAAVGTVMLYRAGAGFGGCDLVDVRYKRPSDGRGSTLPFGLCCLQATTPAELTRLVERYERLAAHLRALAKAGRRAM